MSLIPTLEKLKDIIETDPAISDYCTGLSSQGLIVRRCFRQRAEIGMDELPICLITRPSSEKSSDSAYTGTSIDTVRMYVGFFSDDPEQAQDILVSLDELIDAAIMADPTLAGLVEYVYPGTTINDEGIFHPVYFMVKEMQIHREVLWRE